mmetsp:Transcript_10753/g.44098  ORF Transcript_10753/g.44098 Transcript_10753/m.44098 type:complete len:750 (+) Transcript_10753:570-2819(+)
MWAAAKVLSLPCLVLLEFLDAAGELPGLLQPGPVLLAGAPLHPPHGELVDFAAVHSEVIQLLADRAEGAVAAFAVAPRLLVRVTHRNPVVAPGCGAADGVAEGHNACSQELVGKPAVNVRRFAADNPYISVGEHISAAHARAAGGLPLAHCSGDALAKAFETEGVARRLAEVQHLEGGHFVEAYRALLRLPSLRHLRHLFVDPNARVLQQGESRCELLSRAGGVEAGEDHHGLQGVSPALHERERAHCPRPSVRAALQHRKTLGEVLVPSREHLGHVQQVHHALLWCLALSLWRRHLLLFLLLLGRRYVAALGQELWQHLRTAEVALHTGHVLVVDAKAVSPGNLLVVLLVVDDVIERAGDVAVLEHRLADLLLRSLLLWAVRNLLLHGIEVGLDELVRDVHVGDEVEELAHGHGGDAVLLEEARNVRAVGLQEGKRVWVVVLHRLGDVDEVQVALEVEDVVLAEVAVDELAGLVHDAHELDALQVERRELPCGEPPAVHCILELGRRHAVLADVGHDQHVLPQVQRLRAENAGLVEAGEVAHLLLGPELDHLAGIVLAEAAPEAEVAGDEALTVLVDEDRRLVHLHRHLSTLLAHARLLGSGTVDAHCARADASAGAEFAVVDVRLLARGDAAVDRVQHVAVQHLEDDHPRPRVQHLLARRPVLLLLLAHHESIILAGALLEGANSSAGHGRGAGVAVVDGLEVDPALVLGQLRGGLVPALVRDAVGGHHRSATVLEVQIAVAILLVV